MPRPEQASRGGTPDPTDWRTYFPLELGNRWQYRVDYFDPPATGYYGFEAVRDTLIEGRHYLALRYCQGDGSTVFCYDQDPFNPFYEVRNDTKNALVVEWVELTNADTYDTWWEPVPCGLDAPFDAVVTCTGPGVGGGPHYFTSGGPGYNLVMPPDTVRGVVYKEFDSIPIVTGAVADFGVVSRLFTKTSPRYETLVYARIGGVEYGTPGFIFPTATELEPESDEAALSVRPNPARRSVRVTFTPARAGPTLLEVHDVRGRRVLTHAVAGLPGVATEAALDLAGLPPGVYVVRVVDGEAVRSALLTVLP